MRKGSKKPRRRKNCERWESVALVTAGSSSQADTDVREVPISSQMSDSGCESTTGVSLCVFVLRVILTMMWAINWNVHESIIREDAVLSTWIPEGMAPTKT